MTIIMKMNKLMEEAHKKICEIDPCSIDKAKAVCDEIAGDNGQLFMAMRVMGWLIEYNEKGDMVAKRKLNT